MAETAKKVKTATKRRKSRKVVKDVVFDISEISTAINQIQIKDKKVGVIFQGRDTEYFYNYTEDLSEFVKELEKFVSEQHISCLLYTSPSPRDSIASRMPSSA